MQEYKDRINVYSGTSQLPEFPEVFRGKVQHFLNRQAMFQVRNESFG